MKLTHNIKNISITASTNINASVDWSYFNKFNSITDKYLPATGEGTTMASQLVTAIAKLVYKWYNDGDVYDNNYGLEGWANDLSSYANWIYNHYPEATDILDSIRDCFSNSGYEAILKALADTLLDPVVIEQSASRKAVGSIYTEDGPFSFTEFSEDEEDDEYYGYDEDDEYDDIYESTSITGNDLSEYYVDNKCQRYIHSLMPEIANLLEDEGYDVSFDENDTTLMISISPQGEERSDGTYSFPKSALDCEGFNTYTDASNIVEILMNRAHFEDLYACDSVTSATVLGWYGDEDAEDYAGGYTEWTLLKSKSVPDYDGFMTEYSLWYNEFTGQYVCILGDTDIYYPENSEPDWECDSEDEAYEWFNSYEGFSDDVYSATSTPSSNRPEYAIWVFSDVDNEWKLWGGSSYDTVSPEFLIDKPEYSDAVVLPNDGISEPDDGRPVKVYSETNYDICPESIQASTTYYFGQEQSTLYGDMIAENLAGRTISKRRDLGDQPGGLVYEATQLGIDMWDLLEALEGMCYEGRAREIDDSTYEVLACDNAVVSSASGWYVGEPQSSVEYGNFITESKWTSWQDVYSLFEAIIDKHFPDEDKIAEAVDKLYNTYRHNRYMRTAYDKWCESGRDI